VHHAVSKSGKTGLKGGRASSLGKKESPNLAGKLKRPSFAWESTAQLGKGKAKNTSKGPLWRGGRTNDAPNRGGVESFFISYGNLSV